MNSDISVIVPYYNESKTIIYTLEQIANQTLKADYAIFINSSSSDNTYSIINEWITLNQKKFSTIFKNINRGTNTPASSKNAGILEATTIWIAFMDCGQQFKTDWLQLQQEYLTKHLLEIVSGNVKLSGLNWIDRCAASHTYGYKRLRPCIPTTLLRKNIFDKTGLFLENRRAGYDAAWPIKLKKLNIQRGINPKVVIEYLETNN